MYLSKDVKRTFTSDHFWSCRTEWPRQTNSGTFHREGPVSGAGLSPLVCLGTSTCITWLVILDFSHKCHSDLWHYWSRTFAMACGCAICQSFFYGSRRSGCSPRTGLGFRPARLAPSSSLCSVLSGRPWRGGLSRRIYLQSSPAWRWKGWPNVLEGDCCWNVLCFPCYCRTRLESHTEPSVLISSCVRSSASTSPDQPWHQQRWRMDLRRRNRRVTTVEDKSKDRKHLSMSIFHYRVRVQGVPLLQIYAKVNFDRKNLKMLTANKCVSDLLSHESRMKLKSNRLQSSFWPPGVLEINHKHLWMKFPDKHSSGW